MQWTDTFDIAIALEAQYPDQDILDTSFLRLKKCVVTLPGFNGAPDKCNEKILEAVQMAWLEVREDAAG